MADQLALLVAAGATHGADGIARSAIFSDDGEHRLRLERRWSDGPTVTFCCKNPSTANGDRDDPSLHRMMFFGRRWGYGRLIVVNGDTKITPYPADLYAWWQTLGPTECYEARSRAIRMIEEAAGESSLFIAAWGASPEGGDHYGKWPRRLRTELIERGIDLHHLGLTAGAWPKHPMARGRHRIPDDQQPIRWAS